MLAQTRQQDDEQKVDDVVIARTTTLGIFKAAFEDIYECRDRVIPPWFQRNQDGELHVPIVDKIVHDLPVIGENTDPVLRQDIQTAFKEKFYGFLCETKDKTTSFKLMCYAINKLKDVFGENIVTTMKAHIKQEQPNEKQKKVLEKFEKWMEYPPYVKPYKTKRKRLEPLSRQQCSQWCHDERVARGRDWQDQLMKRTVTWRLRTKEAMLKRLDRLYPGHPVTMIDQKWIILEELLQHEDPLEDDPTIRTDSDKYTSQEIEHMHGRWPEASTC